jgi:hypothetical protein
MTTLAADVQFAGQTECRRDGCGPLGLILRGHTADHPHELVQLSFTGQAPQDLPKYLADPRVEHLSAGNYRITSGARSWSVNAGAVHLHRDVTREFYRALPAQPIRWSERLFWRIILALATSSAGRKVISRIRK